MPFIQTFKIMYAIGAIIIILVVVAPPTIESKDWKEVNCENGIFFEDIGTAKFYHKNWNLVVYIDNKSHKLHIGNLIKTLDDVTNWCKDLTEPKLKDYCLASIESDKLQLGQICKNEAVLEELKRVPKLRWKRSFWHSLGALNNEDGKYYDVQIGKLLDGTVETETLLKNHTVIMQSTLDHLNVTEYKIQKDLNQINLILTDSANNMTNFIDTTEQIAQLKQIISSIAAPVMTRQEQLKNILTLAETGVIHPDLLSLSYFEEQLGAVKKADLFTELDIPFEVRGSALFRFNKLIKVTTGMVEDRLIVEIKIPIVEKNKYTLTVSHPCPHRSTADIWAYILTDTPYLAIDPLDNKVVYLRDKNFNECKMIGPQNFICPYTGPKYDTDIPDCIIGIRLNKTIIPSNCDEY